MNEARGALYTWMIYAASELQIIPDLMLFLLLFLFSFFTLNNQPSGVFAFYLFLVELFLFFLIVSFYLLLKLRISESGFGA